MIEFIFTPWRKICAYRDKKIDRDFLGKIAKDGQAELRRGIKSPPKTGRIYMRKHGRHQASRAGEYPANETGALAASAKTSVTRDTATVGTTVFYGKFLREGTRKMARRKMSDSALSVVVPRNIGKLRGFIRWKEE